MLVLNSKFNIVRSRFLLETDFFFFPFPFSLLSSYGECWTDSKLANTSLPVGYGQCGAACLDAPTQMCGGSTGKVLKFVS